MAERRKSRGRLAVLFLCLALVAAFTETGQTGIAPSPTTATIGGDDANPGPTAAVAAPAPVLPGPEQGTQASAFVGPLNFRQQFLPEVLRVFRMVLDEELDDSVSVDVLNDVDFVDGSKYAAAGF